MLEFRRAFKRKTIEKHLKDKVNHWLKSLKIEEKDAKEEDIKANREFISSIRSDLIITGGAIASMQMGHLPNDYDIYFKTKSIAISVAKHYVSKLPESQNKKVKNIEISENEEGIYIKVKSAGVAGEEIDQISYDYFEYMPANSSEEYLDQIALKNTGKYKIEFMTSNAITLSDGIQIIVRFCGGPETIHENFDFVHCTNYWTYDGGLVTNFPAMECIISRELRYVGSRYPICSIFRLRKFIERGWTITAGEIFKISWDVNKLDLTNMDTLRDQLVGVDSSCFNEVIRVLKDNYREGDIDRTYLFELINRSFDAHTDDFAENEGLE